MESNDGRRMVSYSTPEPPLEIPSPNLAETPVSSPSLRASTPYHLIPPAAVDPTSPPAVNDLFQRRLDSQPPTPIPRVAPPTTPPVSLAPILSVARQDAPTTLSTFVPLRRVTQSNPQEPRMADYFKRRRDLLDILKDLHSTGYIVHHSPV